MMFVNMKTLQARSILLRPGRCCEEDMMTDNTRQVEGAIT